MLIEIAISSCIFTMVFVTILLAASFMIKKRTSLKKKIEMHMVADAIFAKILEDINIGIIRFQSMGTDGLDYSKINKDRYFIGKKLKLPYEGYLRKNYYSFSIDIFKKDNDDNKIGMVSIFLDKNFPPYRFCFKGCLS